MLAGKGHSGFNEARDDEVLQWQNPTQAISTSSRETTTPKPHQQRQQETPV